MEIVERIPRTRTQEKLIFDGGREVVRCYSPSNSHFYKNENDQLFPIDTSFEKSVTTKIGNIRIREKNVFSVGYREDNDPYKYVGIRPDTTQTTGTEQIEFTIKEIIINGKNIPIDLSKNETLENNPNIIDLGNVLVLVDTNFTRQMIESYEKIESFKITYEVHLKGFNFVNDKHGSGFFTEDEEEQFVISNDSGTEKFAIRRPVLLDKAFEQIFHYLEEDPDIMSNPFTDHTLKDLNDGSYEYVKYSTSEQIPPNAKYIDAFTEKVSPSADGYAYLSKSISPKKFSYQEIFSRLKDSSIIKATYAKKTGNFNNFIISHKASYHKLWRTFLSFDTSGITSATLASINIHAQKKYLFPRAGYGANGDNPTGVLADGSRTSVVAVASTHSNSIKVHDWDAIQIAQYGTSKNYSEPTPVADGDFTTIFLDQNNAISDVNSSSLFKLALLVSYDYAYDPAVDPGDQTENIPPGGLGENIGARIFSDTVGGTPIVFRPYMDINLGYGQGVFGVTAAKLKKVMSIPNQQIAKALGT